MVVLENLNKGTLSIPSAGLLFGAPGTKGAFKTISKSQLENGRIQYFLNRGKLRMVSQEEMSASALASDHAVVSGGTSSTAHAYEIEQPEDSHIKDVGEIKVEVHTSKKVSEAMAEGVATDGVTLGIVEMGGNVVADVDTGDGNTSQDIATIEVDRESKTVAIEAIKSFKKITSKKPKIAAKTKTAKANAVAEDEGFSVQCFGVKGDGARCQRNVKMEEDGNFIPLCVMHRGQVNSIKFVDGEWRYLAGEEPLG